MTVRLGAELHHPEHLLWAEAAYPWASMNVPKSNDPCWCGSGKKFKRCHKEMPTTSEWERTVFPGIVSARRPVPENIERPDYIGNRGKPKRNNYPLVKSPELIQRMRRTSALTAEVLAETGSYVKPGITTEELDAIAHEAYIKRGGYPSCVGYGTYEKSICSSVNEVICHGIPDNRSLVEGDIVNIDVSMFKEGVHGDCSATFLVGEVSDTARRLVAITEESMYRGINVVAPNVKLNEIGRVIQDTAERHGYSVVEAFVGHGIGENFHMAPSVLHYFDRGVTSRLQAGMTFTIEPMIAVGDGASYDIWPDGWTAVTADNSLTAQFEHTVLVTETGVEILTKV
jgi:methionyl aminopeptidase